MNLIYDKLRHIKWKTAFADLKLSRKMILVYGIAMGVSCVISMIALQVSLGIYDRQLYAGSQQELDFFTQKVNDSLDDVERFSFETAMDNEIQAQLEKMASMEYLSAAYGYERQRLREMLFNRMIPYEEIENVIYTDRDQITMMVGVDRGEIEEGIYNGLLEAFSQKKGGYAYVPPTPAYPYMLSGRDVLLKANARLDYLGSLIFTADISDIIKKQSADLEAPHSLLTVYWEHGKIYDELGEEYENIDKQLPYMEECQGYKIIRHNGERYFLCFQKSEKTGWMYVNAFPYSEIFGKTMGVRYLMIIAFAAIFLIMTAVMKRIADIVTMPLEQLTESMKIVETGDFSKAKEVLVVENRMDEAGQLSEEFRFMLGKIEELIHENYEKQLLLQKTKYKMLQAQINPHFLYNTLNALNWMVKAGRKEDAGEMIMELGKLLRASFAKDPYATIQQEAEIAESYITIQRFRYGSRIRFDVRREGCLEKYKIPRMILQPLVENAINYGADQMAETCEIRVHITEEENQVLLQVADSGKGMTAEELQSVRDFTFQPKGNGIGLKNIRDRLSLIYHEESQFQIESEPGKGTRVTIRIPKRETL